MSDRKNIRAVMDSLFANPDGLTVTQIAEMSGCDKRAIANVCQTSFDTYIDRWQPNSNGTAWAPVYCLHPRMPDAPKPTVRVSEFLRSAHV